MFTINQKKHKLSQPQLRSLKASYTKERNKIIDSGVTYDAVGAVMMEKIQSGELNRLFRFIAKEQEFSFFDTKALARKFTNDLKLKNSVLVRDGHTCKVCRSVYDLKVVHKKTIEEAPELALYASNLYVLCRPCIRIKNKAKKAWK